VIRLQSEDFSVSDEIETLVGSRTDVGAVVTFTGLVRDIAGAETISSMTLEHYPAMAQKQLADVERQARARWPLQDALIIHRYGRLEPGDQIVLVITASAHREAAFEAAEFLMDWLKTKAPFWKLEETSDGESWVDARATDDAAAKRWLRKE
jgi:molybdopterin synthase catalytic subunit